MDPSRRILAQGCFGKVYRQKYGDKWAAIKKVPMNLITEGQLLRVSETAKHTNVVKLLGKPWVEDGRWHIPLEFVFGEDLETAIFNVQKSKIQLSPSVKATIITGMCEGLYFLHLKDIVHQDLNPNNIMIEHGSHRAVIIHLGLAKFLKSSLISPPNLGNEAYTAPEIMRGGVRDKRSDVWAMGKVIAELCQTARLTSASPIRVKEVLTYSPYCSVVSSMMMTSAAERATMAGVINEIRQIGAGAGKPNAALVACVPGAFGDLGLMDTQWPLNAFQPEANLSETPGLHNLHRPFPQHPALGHFFDREKANMFPGLLPTEGRVIHHHHHHHHRQVEVKRKVTSYSKVLKYEEYKEVKISK